MCSHSLQMSSGLFRFRKESRCGEGWATQRLAEIADDERIGGRLLSGGKPRRL
jgi:hypothetical protein